MSEAVGRRSWVIWPLKNPTWTLPGMDAKWFRCRVSIHHLLGSNWQFLEGKVLVPLWNGNSWLPTPPRSAASRPQILGGVMKPIVPEEGRVRAR